MRTPRRSLTSVTAALLVLLSACTSSVQGTPSSSGTVTGPAGGGIAAALALVPAEAASADLFDLAAAKQRWGLTAVTSETDENAPDAVAFREKLVATGLGTTLLNHTPLFEDAGWNGYDVETEIRPAADGPPVTIYRIRSTLDMQTVIDSFTADGMTRSGTDDAPFFRAESLGEGKFGRVFLSGVTVHPALHLVIGGPQGSWTMPADGSSLATVEGVPALLADLPAADWAAVDTGTAACTDPLVAGGSRATPEIARRYLATLDAAGERKPVTTVVVAATADDAGQVRTGYADEAAAAADLPVRTKILQTVDSLVGQRPYAELFTAQIAASGATLRYDVEAERGSILRQSREQRDTPWSFC